MKIKFLKLTETMKDGHHTILVNPAHIVQIKLGNAGKDTFISMGDGKYFFVKESVAQIEEML